MVAESVTTQTWTEALHRGAAAKRAMLRMEGGVLSATEFADRLGLVPRELNEMRLFSLEVDDVCVYPTFQLTDDGLLPGIEQVVEAFTVEDPWMRANFMLTGDARLAKRRPIDLLRKGRLEEVVRAARAYGKHGAA